MPDGWIFTMQTEAERDWETDEDKWTIPIGPFVSKLLDIGGQKISFQRGPLWCAGELDKSPDWSLRLKAVFPFPKQALGAAANMRSGCAPSGR
jgi:hypothetical protein